MEQIMEQISLWPSVESRLKMLDIITVRVYTGSVIAGCSHSDKESYKNLRHGDWTDPAAAQTLSLTHSLNNKETQTRS